MEKVELELKEIRKLLRILAEKTAEMRNSGELKKKKVQTAKFSGEERRKDSDKVEKSRVVEKKVSLRK